MALDIKIMCPLMKGPCIEDGTKVGDEVHACRFWVTVQGTNPQDGSTTHVKDCSFALLPVLMIDNSKTNRETGAAVESLRNEVSNGNQQVAQQLLLGLTQNRTTQEKPALLIGHDATASKGGGADNAD